MCIARIQKVLFCCMLHIYLLIYFIFFAAAAAHIFCWAVIVVIKAQRPNRRPNESSFVMDNSENILTRMMHHMHIMCLLHKRPISSSLFISFFL